VIRSDATLADPSSSIERFLRDRLPPDLRSRVALDRENVDSDS
jgi:hypothetical protein